MASPSLHFADPASNLMGSFASFRGPKCRRKSCLRAMASSSSKNLEIVYDPVGRYEELTRELQTSGGFARNLTLFSPSKINVFLRITSKRPDGYHDLASLFHVISLGDTLKFSVSPSKKKDSLTTNVFGIPLDDSNLVIKALNLYRKKTGSDTYFWVHLDKRVPSGAGLGGGSGNAATALWAANQINGNLASEADLQEWSAEIGSDIPFFFSHGAAFCTGRGEIVRDIPAPLPLDTPLVLIKPKEACPTAEVYKHFRIADASSEDPEELLRKIIENGVSQDVCINDLEAPAFQVLPSLKALKQRIMAASRGKYKSLFMSGSGSTLVGVGDPEPPEFIYDDEQHSDTFVSEAYFVTRRDNEWYQQPLSQPEAVIDKHDINEVYNQLFTGSDK
ncbi:4-diphosphocytidyl-2-C-methyl-D-erythritol kinase, chloroplastic/chromoplastic [Selaginella moellendorffii]|uniref:4-diphosphocytidyl-2-C-methyl-D-erythritol kinase, chloroplastic/chromoplastic n=1 Tax=Selaginella moellendorffii TaxID=88036 RepID=UPI000D1CDA89|nr:4-diphosphocytidyl-2-C-methyl-D-erythritol kinase, chloroplastic/chromoplastic [Selaginella moellendorffii]|eukprot:XP_024543978.1 4-diphosphocytidyl-2-C-methyl-D-erythritol kinase, chloroplastic/chromoplastic [Selaginella moellendorffii]